MVDTLLLGPSLHVTTLVDTSLLLNTFSSINCSKDSRVSVNSILRGSVSWFKLFVIHYEDDQLKGDELGGACSKYVGEEKCMKISGLDSK
jgi:hypothetical protein